MNARTFIISIAAITLLGACAIEGAPPPDPALTASEQTSCHPYDELCWCPYGVVGREVGYGEMGYHGAYSECWRDFCADGLVPHNVDSNTTQYNRAPDGWFSCWWNTPDVICYSQAPINWYINVRQCYVRPDGSREDYGCNDCGY